MKKMMAVFVAVVSFLSFTPLTEKGTAENGSITVTVNEIEEQKGQIVFMLFDQEDGFPKEIDKAYKKGMVKSFNTSATFTFKNVPYGDYAIAVFHDSDSDGNINTNLIGMPKESVGASNMTKLGKPNFKKCTINLDNASLEVSIKFIL